MGVTVLGVGLNPMQDNKGNNAGSTTSVGSQWSSVIQPCMQDLCQRTMRREIAAWQIEVKKKKIDPGYCSYKLSVVPAGRIVEAPFFFFVFFMV